MAISKVVVVDGNNLTVRIDRGVAGRGITDVQPIEIDNQLYLEFTFSDGTTETVGPVGTIQYIGESPIVIDGPTISLTTVPVTLGGTNATTAAGARTNLNAANQDTTISAGTGLSGGGSLAANRTISIANTAVTAGSYGASSKTLTATVNAQGQLTALADTPIAIDNTQISGLGTMSTQNANAVAITGGSITGITDLAVADGGTGASTAADARTNLNAANQDTTISAGTGLSGGGSLAANRTLSIANTGVTAGSFGSASNTLSATVNAQGQLTSLAATPIAIANTQVSGLGTASTLNAGVANGVATLDAGGTVPLSQIPASIQGGVSYQGSWNAATNTPTIVSGVGSKGHYYVVSVAGSTNIDGITDWLPGDWIIFNGSVWEQIDNTDTVQSVNGYVGAVVLTAADVGAPPTTRTITAGTGLSGGGDLSANRTINIANTAVTAGSYGTASSVPSITVNAQGQLTAASNTTIAITNTQVSGLGTMSTQNANSVAITGGAIDGTTIGGTTAAAGAFTTLTTSGAVTHNGGVANGITYLNGSKVLTTGTALTFDGTNFAVTGNTATTVQASSRNDNNTTNAGAKLATLYLSTEITSLGHYWDGSQFIGKVNALGDLLFTRNNAEQMRLNSTGLGIGTSSPGAKLDVKGGTTISTLAGWNTLSNSMFELANPAVRFGIGYDSSDQVLLQGFDSSNDARNIGMQVYGGNLGIGTSSPANGLLNIGTDGASKGIAINAGSQATYGYLSMSHYTNGAFISTYAGSSTASDIMRFGTTGTERMRLDSSGNLGLGVTPSAFWASSQGPAYQIGAFTSVFNNAYLGAAEIAYNTVRNGNDTYVYTNSGVAASRLQQRDGAFKFFTAPSGTAGAAISFTQAMTLDASGNLGLGTSSPGYKLDVRKGSVGDLVLFTDAVNQGMTFGTTAGVGTNGGFYFNEGNGGSIYFQQSGTTKLTIDASGNLGLGVTPTTGGYGGGLQISRDTSSDLLTLWTQPINTNDHRVSLTNNAKNTGVGTWSYFASSQSATMYQQMAGAHQWWTAGTGTAGNAISFTQAMTLDASGNLLVGATSSFSAGKLQVQTDNWASQFYTTANSGAGLCLSTRRNNDGVAVAFLYNGADYSSAVGNISVTSTSTAYNTSSDYRLKENIQPMTGALAKVAALKPVTYKWKADGSDGEGFIAHELAEVVPQCVTGEKDAVDAEGKPVYQGIDTSFLVATLTAAIQEQQAIINDLRARVAQLESN